MSNWLKNAVSPYLLQHAENPVDWYPWCDEAFERAQTEDKPIFLSIGYSTCHWCHVMAHESFENHTIAEILNQHFICIKVDREERPDIDSVYMTACQALTGSGGWPMSIFMTWDKQPFFAGTYFPPKVFTDLLYRIAAVWHENRNDIVQSADSITAHLRQTEQPISSGNSDNLIEQAIQFFRQSFDAHNGGFGDAPKFPATHNLLFLLLYAKQTGNQTALHMAEKTLLQFRLGGIYDQIGGGFSRYSTDRYFFAPHFEKMLYDNALLIMAYAAAYSLIGNALYLETATNTADYILREMTAPEGGFYSAQDADSDGEEGKFYTFTLTEISDVLGQDTGTRFADVFDISEKGNFDGKNIPNLLKTGTVPHDLDAVLQKLYDYRKQRMKLHTDDKILLSWNSMMIAAMSMLYRVSHQQTYLDAAKKARDFLLKHLCDNKRLFGTWRNGIRSDTAFLDDYAYFAAGLIELYNSTLDAHDLDLAEQFCAETVRRFADREHGGFMLCEQGSDELFLNPKDTYDNAVPSGNSVMAYNFVRLYQLTEKEKYQELAEQQIQLLSAQAQDIPAGHCFFLLAKLLYENPPPHIVIVPQNADDLHEISLPFLANCIIQRESESNPLVNNQTTFYVCQNQMCLPPSNQLTV